MYRVTQKLCPVGVKNIHIVTDPFVRGLRCLGAHTTPQALAPPLGFFELGGSEVGGHLSLQNGVHLVTLLSHRPHLGGVSHPVRQ